jgi:hypothetical protein
MSLGALRWLAEPQSVQNFNLKRRGKKMYRSILPSETATGKPDRKAEFRKRFIDRIRQYSTGIKKADKGLRDIPLEDKSDEKWESLKKGEFASRSHCLDAV